MFAQLNKLSESEIRDCPYIWVSTPFKDIVYQIVSLHQAETECVTFTLFHPEGSSPGKEFKDWKSSEIEKSTLGLDVPEDAKDKFLTLSTCTPSSNGQRTVMQACQLKTYGK